MNGISEKSDIHILHVVRQFYPAVGGLEDSVANLAAELNAMQGVTTSVLTLDRVFGDRSIRLASRGEYRGVRITRIPFFGSKRYPVALSVLRHLSKANIVHVHGIDFNFDFLSATRLFHRKPLVVSTHGGFFHTEFASRLKRLYFRSVTRFSAKGYVRIFGSSESDTAMFSSIAPSKTITIENGVNIYKWANTASRQLVPSILCLGRFSSNKAIPDLFALLAALRARGSFWRLIVAGQESDLSVADLKRAAAAFGVADAVKIVVGAADEELVPLISKASYICSASRYEGFGLGVVEGMSAGLTPFVSNIAPFERLISTSGCGRVFDPRDPEAGAGILLNLHNLLQRSYQGHRASNMSAAARYGWAEPAARLAAIYRSIIPGKVTKALS